MFRWGGFRDEESDTDSVVGVGVVNGSGSLSRSQSPSRFLNRMRSRSRPPARSEFQDFDGEGEGDARLGVGVGLGVYGEIHTRTMSTRSSLGSDDASRYSSQSSPSPSPGPLSGSGSGSPCPLALGSSSPSPSSSSSPREGFGFDEETEGFEQEEEEEQEEGGNLSSSSSPSSTSAHAYEFHWNLGEGEGDGEGSSAPSTPWDHDGGEEGEEGGCEEVSMSTSPGINIVERRGLAFSNPSPSPGCAMVDADAPVVRVIGDNDDDNGDGFYDPQGVYGIARTRNHKESKVKNASVIKEEEEEDEQGSEYLDVRLAAELFEKIVSPPSPSSTDPATVTAGGAAPGTTDSTSTTNHRPSASRTRRQGMCPPPPSFGGTGPVPGAPGYSYFGRRDSLSLNLTSSSGVGFCRLSLPDSSPPPPLPPLPHFPLPPTLPKNLLNPLPPILPARCTNPNEALESVTDADEKVTHNKNIEVQEKEKEAPNLNIMAMTRSTSTSKTKGKKEFVDYKKELLDTVLAIENSFMEPFRRAGGGVGGVGGMSDGHGDVIFGWDFNRARDREKKKGEGNVGVRGFGKKAKDGGLALGRGERIVDIEDRGVWGLATSSSASCSVSGSGSGNYPSSTSSASANSLASSSSKSISISGSSPTQGPPPSSTRPPLRPSLKRRPSAFILPQPSSLNEDPGKDMGTGMPLPKLPPPPMSMSISVSVPAPVRSSASTMNRNNGLVASHSPPRLQSQSQLSKMSVSPSSTKKRSTGSKMVVVNAYGDVNGRSVPPPPIPSMAPPPMPPPVLGQGPTSALFATKCGGAKIKATSSANNVLGNTKERGSSLSILSTITTTRSARIPSIVLNNVHPTTTVNTKTKSETEAQNLNERIILPVPGHITRIRGPGKHIRKPSTYTITSASSSSSESVRPRDRKLEIQNERASLTARRGQGLGLGLGLGLSIPGPDSLVPNGAIRIGVTRDSNRVVAARTETSRVGVGVVWCDSGEVEKGVVQAMVVVDEAYHCSEQKEKECVEEKEVEGSIQAQGPTTLVDLETGSGNGASSSSAAAASPCDELKTRTRVQTQTQTQTQMCEVGGSGELSALAGSSDHSGFVGLVGPMVSDGTFVGDENKPKPKPKPKPKSQPKEVMWISKFPLVQVGVAGAVTATAVSLVDVDVNLSVSRVREVEVKLTREHIVLRRKMQMRTRTRRVGVGVGVMDDYGGGVDGVVIPPRTSRDLDALCMVIGEGEGRVGVVVGDRF